MEETTAKKKRFKVALSFPGEQRDYISQVANELAKKLGKENVFYDKWYAAELARPELDTYLQDIYHKYSELLVPFFSEDYKKEWCRLEWKVIRDVMRKRGNQYVMPMRFDNTEIPGLFSGDGYLDLNQHNTKQVAEMIVQRLQDNGTAIEKPPKPSFNWQSWLIASLGGVAMLVTLWLAYQQHFKSPFLGSDPISLKSGIKLIKIPKDDNKYLLSFTMGGNEDYQKPKHIVRFSEPFWISQTEITVEQYQSILNLQRNKSLNADLPITNVNVEDTTSFTKQLSEMNKNMECRLPTEAEWEFAARAGTTTAYSWGDQSPVGKAVCKGCGDIWSQNHEPAPVGSFAKKNVNAFGLHDMHGNVAEWVEDAWHDDYEGAPSNGRAWNGGSTVQSNVVRGGSWADKPDQLKSAFREQVNSVQRTYTIGFRVVCRFKK